MAKRREGPATNPLQRDLVAGISSPVTRPPVVEADPKPPVEKRKPRPEPQRRGRRTVTMKTRFPAEEAEENARLVRQLADLFGREESKLTESHVTRAIWTLVRRAEDEYDALADKAPPLRRAAHGDHLATAAYEDALADFLLAAIKRVKPDNSRV